MTNNDEAAPVDAELRDLRLESDEEWDRTGRGEHHTLVDEVVGVGETIRAILSL